MNKTEAENSQVTIYWWNGRFKTLEHKGTYKEYLLSKGIKVSRTTHPNHREIKGYRFTYTSSTIIKIESFDCDYVNALNLIIRIFLSYLGDKAFMRDCYGREFKINWGN